MLAQALAAFRGVGEVLLGDEADRATASELTADRAGDDVDLVEPGAGNQQIGSVDPRSLKKTVAGAAAGQEFDVEQAEPVRHARLGIDDAQLVVWRHRLGERIPDLASPDDDDLRCGVPKKSGVSEQKSEACEHAPQP